MTSLVETDLNLDAFYCLHLYKNREQLATHSTLATDGMLKFLTDAGVLLLPDVAHLNNSKLAGKDILAQELIRILAVRKNGFPSLLKGLQQEKQLEVARLLEDNFRKEYRQFYNKLALGEQSDSENDEDDSDDREPPNKSRRTSEDGLAKYFIFDSSINTGYAAARTLWQFGAEFLCWIPPIGNYIGGGDQDASFLQDIPDRSAVAMEINLENGRTTRVISTKASYVYNETSRIHRGYTADVFIGYLDNDPHTRVAIKFVYKDKCLINSMEVQIAKQIWATRSHKTTYIVPVYETSEDNTCYYIVMELAEKSLEKAVTSNDCGITENKGTVISLLRNCVEGLRWLHEDKKLVHRDIKPQNILLFRYDNGPVAKLADFGICRQEGADTRINGSDHWMSPEALQALHDDQRFVNTQKMDIFSLGMVFYFCLSGGQHPFRVGDTLTSNIKNKQFLAPNLGNADHHFQTAAADHLIQWMMQKEPERRPTIAQVQAHPMFWDAVECLKFLEDVARSLSNKKCGSECMQVRQKIDESFQILHKSRTGQNPSWMSVVNPNLFHRNGPGSKKYTTESLISLVELIRDKAEHYPDIVQDLLALMFEDGAFNRKRYALYFLEKFPNIVIFLFEWLVKEAKNYCCLNTLSNDYLHLF